MTPFRSLLATAVAAVAVVAASACVPPTPPQPDPLLVCDTLTVVSGYSPPATTAADDVSGSLLAGSGLSGCTDQTGRGITGATLSGSFDVQGACSPHPAGQAWGWGTGDLEWSDGSTSDWTAELVAEAPLRVELRVTGGFSTGATASLPMDVVGVLGDCASAGIAQVIIEGGPFVLRPAGSTGPEPLGLVDEITAGAAHTCALVDGTSARCWGDNSHGQLGLGTWDPGGDELVPVEVVGLGTASALAAGDSHTCAVVADGRVRCWGLNDAGQLGDGTTTDSSVPVEVAGLSGATDVAAGVGQSCALVDGAPWCWGSGTLVPVQLPGVSDATAISVGGSPYAAAPGPHACALRADGTVVCWGNNAFGQLGDGTNSSSQAPVAVVGIQDASAVVAGPYGSSCAVVADGVRCWGRNDFGQLGDGTTASSNVPVAVAGVPDAVEVALGAVHGCASLTDGSATCWGNNDYGQLGTGTLVSSALPAQVVGLTDSTGIVAGHYSTCAPRAGGFASCWGGNGSGQLGTGDRSGASVPGPVIAAF